MKLENLEKYFANNNSEIICKERNTWDKYMEVWNINYSIILTRLIKEAAKCKSYSSDLFISWNNVEKDLHEMKEGEKKIHVFGFRELGVDGNAFCNSRLANSDDEYFSIYLLTMKIVDKRNDGILEMETILYKYK